MRAPGTCRVQYPWVWDSFHGSLCGRPREDTIPLSVTVQLGSQLRVVIIVTFKIYEALMNVTGMRMNSSRLWKAHAPKRLATPAKLAEIELTDTDIALACEDSYRMARLLIRVHGQPVGYVDLSVDMLPTLDHA